ncbi:MAG: TIGR00730 family Rossman fold protein [Chloroflexota bacterium]
MEAVCVFCGSSDNVDNVYLVAADKMGEEMASRGLRLVYGAGITGLMGTLARTVLVNDGEVFGVLPKIFDTPELSMPDITQFELVETMHLRKARMYELSDAFIAMPGGFGTMDELFETITWAQVGVHKKPIGILNTNGYYDLLIEFLDSVERKGFAYKGHNRLFISADNPADLLDGLNAYKTPDDLHKWLER